MIVNGIPPILAPQPTGHPASLPQDTIKHANVKRVAPTDQGDSTSNARTGTERQPDTGTPRPAVAPDPEPDVAPPTLLQLKINSMLREQAEETRQERLKEAAELPEPRPRTELAEPEKAPPTAAARETYTRHEAAASVLSKAPSKPEAQDTPPPIAEIPQPEVPQEIGVAVAATHMSKTL